MERTFDRHCDLPNRVESGHDEVRLIDQLLIIGADHPSLVEAVAEFNAAIGELHSLDPVPDQHSCPARQAHRGPSESEPFGGFRFSAMLNGRIIAAARVDANGDLRIAVLPEFRGKGVATYLSVACVARARLLGYSRLTMRASQRSQRARQVSVAERVQLLDRGAGHIDLMLDYAPVPHSA
jgi:GNAT superfamily N-acetyltransferase